MRKILIACIVLITSVSLWAEDYRGYRYEVTPYIGTNFADNKSLTKDSNLVGLNFSTYFSENLGIRLGYERLLAAKVKATSNKLNRAVDETTTNTASANASATNIVIGETDVNRFYLNGIFKMSSEYFYFTPYLVLGGGYEAFEDKIIRGGQWFANAGAGLNYAFSERVSIGPEIRAIRKFRSNSNMDVIALLTASYRFGLDKPAPPPIVLPAPPPKIKVVEKIVVKEKPIERIVYKNVPVEKIIYKNIPVEKIVYKEVVSKGSKQSVNACVTPKNYKDRCDNSYFVQISAALICDGCEDKFRNSQMIQKLEDSGYNYEVFRVTKKSGKLVDRLLVGPLKCKADAFKALCDIKTKKIASDAFIFSKKDYKQ